MNISFITCVRAALLACALTFAAPAVEARSTLPTAAPAANAPATADPDDVPVDGLLIIAGIVGVVILLAWVCSRVGDSRAVMT